MLTLRRLPQTGLLAALALVLTFPACSSPGGRGATTGLGIGTLIGGLAGNREGALIGAGVGAGVGFLIGDATDQSRVEDLDEAPAADLEPLAGTEWRLQKLEADEPHDLADMTATFLRDGTVRTTKTMLDGRQETTIERYRIVGDTLIVNRDDYLMNMPFSRTDDRLSIEKEDGRWVATLARVR